MRANLLGQRPVGVAGEYFQPIRLHIAVFFGVRQLAAAFEAEARFGPARR